MLDHLTTSGAKSGRVLPRHRRRDVVSLSAPEPGIEPVEQLDRAVEIIHQLNRGLPATVPDRDELIALGGLLTQLTCALLTLTNLLATPVHHCERTHVTTEGTDANHSPTAVRLLGDCRDSLLAASTSARALHAHLKR